MQNKPEQRFFNHVMYEFMRGIREMERLILVERERWHHKWGKHAHNGGFSYFINKIKITFSMGTLKLPFGTPITGKGNALDVKGNILTDDHIKAGSVKFGSSDESVLTVQQDPLVETRYSVTQLKAGTANVTFDFQDVHGTDVPQSFSTIILTEVEILAVAGEVDFDQESHD